MQVEWEVGIFMDLWGTFRSGIRTILIMISYESIEFDSGRAHQIQDSAVRRPASGQDIHHREIHQQSVWRVIQRTRSHIQATIGIDFLVKNLIYRNKSYRLQLWDTAGQERFRSLIPSYLKDSHLCILVYDLTNSASLDNLSKWLELYDQHREYTAFAVAVGNKSDLVSRYAPTHLGNALLSRWRKNYLLFEIVRNLKYQPKTDLVWRNYFTQL